MAEHVFGPGRCQGIHPARNCLIGPLARKGPFLFRYLGRASRLSSRVFVDRWAERRGPRFLERAPPCLAVTASRASAARTRDPRRDTSYMTARAYAGRLLRHTPHDLGVGRVTNAVRGLGSGRYHRSRHLGVHRGTVLRRPLADLGARIIEVEPPDGADEHRLGTTVARRAWRSIFAVQKVVRSYAGWCGESTSSSRTSPRASPRNSALSARSYRPFMRGSSSYRVRRSAKRAHMPEAKGLTSSPTRGVRPYSRRMKPARPRMKPARPRMKPARPRTKPATSRT